jgi:DNA repair protein RadC
MQRVSMPHSDQAASSGHRARLRQRFLADPTALSDAELVELVLTYVIPRQDVASQAQALLARFGSPAGLLTAPYGELLAVPGIGEGTALFLRALGQLSHTGAGEDGEPETADAPTSVSPVPVQAALFPPEAESPDDASSPDPAPVNASDGIRTFADDEAANALTFLPQAARYATLEDFKAYLGERLPYNSASTRRRRANYILDRFFRDGRLDTPLTFFAARCASPEDLKPAIFYHLLRAEPLAVRVADDLVWPALPVGRLGRADIREFVLQLLPDLGAASQAKVLQAIFNTYTTLGVGVGAGDRDVLRFQAHAGTLEGELYLLTAEFPAPGSYSFDALEASPLRRWLLWDRDWLRRQLYNLQDLGVLSKVSEIDTVRQFALPFDQMTALRRYFGNPQRGTVALREGM